MSSKPLISFGLLTDIQYADYDNTLNYRKDKPRYYRNSLNLVKEAAHSWHSNIKYDNFQFIIQLGDIIDCKAVEYREKALTAVLKEMKSDFETNIQNFRIYHIWGNHEFYNYSREHLLQTELNSAALLNPEVSNKANYYRIDVTDDFKIICLDIFEFSVIGYKNKDSEVYKNALKTIRAFNKNENINSAKDLSGLNKRMTAINGAPSKEQMIWLESQLEELTSKNKKAIVCGHTPIHPKSGINACLAWNFNELLDLFFKYKNTILAYLCGHDHDGGYYLGKSSKIHYITVPSIVEAPPNVNSFAKVKVFNDKIIIEGVGLMQNYEIPFSK